MVFISRLEKLKILKNILKYNFLNFQYFFKIVEDLEELVVNTEVVKNNREPLQIFTDKKNKVDTSA